MSLADKQKIINEALLLVGDRPIAGLIEPSNDDDPAASTLAVSLYDPIVNAAFATRRWRFNLDVEQLNTPQGATIPQDWDHIFQRPTEALTINDVTLEDGTHVRFDVFGDKIVTKGTGDNDVVVCVFNRTVDEALWPPLFRMGVVFSLASAFATSIVENARLSEGMTLRADQQFSELARQESAGRSPSRVDLSYIKLARRGYRLPSYRIT